MRATLGDDAPSLLTVQKWTARFRREREGVLKMTEGEEILHLLTSRKILVG